MRKLIDNLSLNYFFGVLCYSFEIYYFLLTTIYVVCCWSLKQNIARMNLSRAVLYSLKMNSLFKIGNRSLRLLNTGVCHQRPLHNFSFHLLGDSTLETFGRNHKVECRLESLFFQPVRFYAKSKDRQKGAKGKILFVFVSTIYTNTNLIGCLRQMNDHSSSLDKLT